MGSTLSKTANGVGTFVGNVLTTPFKAFFGGSCEGVCLGTWDVKCFLEHLCFSNLFKLLLVLGLCFLMFVFLYLLCKLGICKCMWRSLCKMRWGSCRAYWFALTDVTCFLWHKLKNVKRVDRRRRRRRFRDVEVGYTTSSQEEGDKNKREMLHLQVNDERLNSISKKRKYYGSRSTREILGRSNSRQGRHHHRHRGHHRHRHHYRPRRRLKNRKLRARGHVTSKAHPRINASKRRVI